jgi:hypothetical protein
VNTLINMARYQLARPALFPGVPWLTLLAAFAVNIARGGDHYRDGVIVIFSMFFVAGAQRVSRWLPFGLALGATRRAFYAGTALLGASASLVSGLALAGLQAVERATGGWGLSVTFFRVPYLLNGPWYATWLTSFVMLSALFAYGMWCGIVNFRWGMPGLLAFAVVQVPAGIAIAFARSWAYPGGQPASLSALGLTGIIAALTLLILAGGHATIRRAAV